MSLSKAERCPLSVGADPLSGESLPGLIMRVAARARFRKADALAALVGLNHPGAAVSAADLKPLARLIRVPQPSLERLAYRPTGPTGSADRTFLGGVVNREFLILAHRRCCPDCLAHSVHHRAAWDFALLTACPLHATRLLDRCPRCSRHLGWRVPAIAGCRCGCDLRQAVRRPVSTREASANRAIFDLISTGRATWLPPALEACPAPELHRLIMCLGMLTTGWRGQRRVEALVQAGLDATADVAAAGVEALRDWPAPIHAHLAAASAGAEARPGRYGARKSMGAFYEWMTQMEPGPVKSALAAAASSFVVRDDALVRRTHRSKLIVTQPPALASLNETADRLGMSGSAVKRMMSAGLLASAPSEGRGMPMLIDRAAAEALAADTSNALDLTEAARALGISKRRLRRLVDGGVLAPIHRGAEAGWARWRFKASSVEELLDRLTPAGSVEATPGTVGFEYAAEAFRRRGVGLAAFIALVADGAPAAAGSDHKAIGLKRLRFSGTEVRALCRSLELAAPLSVQSASERMGLKWQVVANLVARRLLGGGNGTVTVAEADVFSAAHVTGAELARRRGTSPRALAVVLSADGVVPIVGPAVDGSRQNIYRIADCAEKLSQSIDSVSDRR